MKGFFAVDGKFHTVMSKITDMIFVVLLWLVGCIPVVTFLTSTASMYTVIVKCIRYDQGRVLPEFWDAYRKNLPQGILLTLIYGALGIVIVWADYQVLFSNPGQNLILSFGLLIVSLVYGLNLLWLAPVFSRFSNTLPGILKLNYVIAIRNFLWCIPMILVLAAAVVLFLAVNSSLFFLPSVVLLIQSYLAEPAMRRYMPPQEEDGDWRYGIS